MGLSLRLRARALSRGQRVAARAGGRQGLAAHACIYCSWRPRPTPRASADVTVRSLRAPLCPQKFKQIPKVFWGTDKEPGVLDKLDVQQPADVDALKELVSREQMATFSKKDCTIQKTVELLMAYNFMTEAVKKAAIDIARCVRARTMDACMRSRPPDRGEERVWEGSGARMSAAAAPPRATACSTGRGPSHGAF